MSGQMEISIVLFLREGHQGWMDLWHVVHPLCPFWRADLRQRWFSPWTSDSRKYVPDSHPIFDGTTFGRRFCQHLCVPLGPWCPKIETPSRTTHYCWCLTPGSPGASTGSPSHLWQDRCRLDLLCCPQQMGWESGTYFLESDVQGENQHCIRSAIPKGQRGKGGVLTTCRRSIQPWRPCIPLGPWCPKIEAPSHTTRYTVDALSPGSPGASTGSPIHPWQDKCRLDRLCGSTPKAQLGLLGLMHTTGDAYALLSILHPGIYAIH